MKELLLIFFIIVFLLELILAFYTIYDILKEKFSCKPECFKTADLGIIVLLIDFSVMIVPSLGILMLVK